MDRPLRALVIAIIAAVAYNALVLIGDHVHAPLLAAVLAQFSHARGFTLGVACGTIATAEPLLLAVYLAAVVLLGPVDAMHVAFAVVGGGGLGAVLKSFVRSHRHDGKSVPDPRLR